MKFITLLAGLLLGLASIAGAAPIDVNSAGFHQYQQTTNSPCIFGENSCQNPSGFGYTSGTSAGPAGEYTLFSSYTVAQIRNLFSGAGTPGDLFFVGVDINQTSRPQTLKAFTITINNVLAYSLPNSTQVPAKSNGNGYADYFLSSTGLTPFSLAGHNANEIVKFGVKMDPANDGGEQFYLLSANASSVPEPASAALIAAGLAVSLALRRFKKA